MDDTEAAQDQADDPPTDGFSGLRPPDFPRIERMLDRLRELAQDPETAASLEAGQKRAALWLQRFLVDQRADGAMPALRDAVAIVAYRCKLKWGATTNGPYLPLVQIVYPGLPQGGYYAIAHVLAECVDVDVAGAERKISSRGGIDAMYRARKPKSRTPPKPRPSPKPRTPLKRR